MKKLLDKASVFLFFAAVLFLSVMSLINWKPIAEEQLSQEEPKLDPTGILSDCFPLRRSWNELYSRTARIMGQDEIFGIYYEKSGDRLIKLFENSDVNYTNNSVAAVNAFHRARSRLPIYMMIVPTASGIYRGRLPLPSEAVDQQKLIDDIYYKIDSEVTPLDVWSPLYAARDDYIYFRTEDRWTPQGAYEAYAASISKLGFAPYSVSNYDVDYTHTVYRGSLAETSGIFDTSADTINVYRCKYGSYIKSCTVLRTSGMIDTRSSVYSKNGLRSDDKYSYFLGTTHYKTAKIKTAVEDGPRLLMIGSDYASCFLPFLAPHYSDIALINPYELDDDEKVFQYLETDQYDQVLILCDVGSFCGDKGLERICFNL